MPRVKIDYVVSFSSEDSDNPASNLLAWEISKKKWLCAKGEPSCSVVLQLPRAVQISQVDIGAYDTALVEVLVGRSERPNDPFEVLVPRCVLQSPAQARAGGGAARVRSFAGPALAEARARRWDRVRLVCSQPYNRHCQYGLSFVHIFEPETAAGAAGAQAGRGADDGDDDFRPGELFAQHRARAAASAATTTTTTAAPTTATATTTTTATTGTDAQIRRGTSRALKNMDDSSTKIVKAPISKAGGGGEAREDEKREAGTGGRRGGAGGAGEGEGAAGAGGTEQGVARGDSLARRRRLALRGAVVALSGFQHPERGRLRELALALGARYDRDAGPATTHLVCAFPNTPKLRALRAAGGAAAAVGAGWLRACWERARRLPWRPHAVEPAQRAAPAEPDRDRDGGEAPGCDAEGDTDDEIEKVLREERRRAPSPRGDDDGALTEAESPPPAGAGPGRALPRAALPAPLAGRVLRLDAALPGCERARLERYIRAAGGLVAQDGAETAAAECVVTSRARGPRSPPHVPPRRLLALLAAHAHARAHAPL